MPASTKTTSQKTEADKIIRRRMLYAAGLGLIPIPVVDVASIFSTQVSMVQEIAELYDVAFKKREAEIFIGVLVGDLGTYGIIKSIPGLGSGLGGAGLSISAAAATYAIGKVFVQHFNQGSTLFEFDPEKSRAYFHQLYEEGQLEDESLKEKKFNPKLTFILIRWFVYFLIVIGIIAGIFYFSRQSAASYAFTDKDLNDLEESASIVHLSEEKEIDSLTANAILSFSPNSTEGVIKAYIESEESRYPKGFVLDAIKFSGKSVLLNNRGGVKQLQNISFLMKKYPDLLITIYGHTVDIGALFDRQKIGRERARGLKDIMEKFGIAGYRIKGNYIEKPTSPDQEYWGADILLFASTVEGNVVIKKSEN